MHSDAPVGTHSSEGYRGLGTEKLVLSEWGPPWVHKIQPIPLARTPKTLGKHPLSPMAPFGTAPASLLTSINLPQPCSPSRPTGPSQAFTPHTPLSQALQITALASFCLTSYYKFHISFGLHLATLYSVLARDPICPCAFTHGTPKPHPPA